MPRIPILKPSEVLRALQRLGFIVVRSKGSHLQLKKGNLLVTVPIHNKDLKPETLRSILRQAKITIEELEKNL
ncbi:MAG: type II toxin-antitoxin system HicA family toxin [bacterium]